MPHYTNNTSSTCCELFGLNQYLKNKILEFEKSVWSKIEILGMCMILKK